MTRLAFTMGDPAGIGPEVCLKAAADPRVQAVCEPVVTGCPEVLAGAASQFRMPMPARVRAVPGPGADFAKGVDSAPCGLAAYRALMAAVDLTLLDAVDGIVTAPLSKAALHLAGIHESGQTEILAKAAGVRRYALMLVSPRLACGFVTCHQSLASVPMSLTIERVVEVAGLMDEALRAIRGRPPRLALLGLNPHAGEGGLFGAEEERVLLPAASLARDAGIDLSDPLPADTAFTPASLERYDGFVCQYHDQGGIPFKMLSFADGVNITLGLPFVRTSVDHGTACDIAWQGVADPSSMVAAALLAASLATPKP